MRSLRCSPMADASHPARRGDVVAGFDVPVVDERVVRAGTGILFTGAMVTFAIAWFAGNFVPLRVFVIVFLIDLLVRLIVSWRLAPSMVIGAWFVRRQASEWVGAAPKRFAWLLGASIASVMFVVAVLLQFVGPPVILLCLTCLVLLFFESVFGICIGCAVFRRLRPDAPSLCVGASCDPTRPPARVDGRGWIVVVAMVVVIVVASAVAPSGARSMIHADSTEPVGATRDAGGAEPDTCTPPQWALDIGHGELWKTHNGC